MVTTRANASGNAMGATRAVMTRCARAGGVAAAAIVMAAGCVADDAEPAVETVESALTAPTAEDFAIQVPGSGLCIDDPGFSTANGQPIQQWGCNGDSNQQWRFTPVGSQGESVYAITSRASGLALDVTAVSSAPGAVIQQWGYGGGANQKFRILDAGGGAFQLQATHDGLCVSVTNTGTAGDLGFGVLLRQYACNASDWHQRFTFQRLGALQKKALVVLIQNGGYQGGLPFNPGFDLPIGLRFGCGGWVVDLPLGSSPIDAIVKAGIPPFNSCVNPGNWWVQTLTQHYTVADWLRQVTNFGATELGKAAVEASGARNRYDTIRYLVDSDINVPRIRHELLGLASSYTIDLHVLAHGDATSFGLAGEVTASGLSGLHNIVGLALRSVYQQNCNGSGLNAAWQAGGAQVVTGSKAINYMPFAYGAFIKRWVAGEPFADAVRRSYQDVKAMHDLAYRFVDLFDEGNNQPRNPPELSPTGQLSSSEELDGSIQIVQGAGQLVL